MLWEFLSASIAQAQDSSTTPTPTVSIASGDQSLVVSYFGTPTAAGIAAAVGTLLLVGLVLLAYPDGRKALRRLYFLVRALVGVEVGLGGFVRIAFYSALPAIAVAFVQGRAKDAVHTFDWHAFWTVFAVITVVGVASNVANLSVSFKTILSPGAGRVWRRERKIATAAVLKKVSRYLDERPTPENLRKMLSDILDIIVMHVRDHRGSFRSGAPDVFANILIAHHEKLVVIARDSMLHTSEYERPTPTTYQKSLLVCGRAIDSKKPISVGVLTDAYPEAPKNKPYRSILAIPLFRAGEVEPYGALSIDSSRPYFFEGFVTGQVENDLENSLQPYLELINLCLEQLAGRSTDAIYGALGHPKPVESHEGAG